MSHFATALAERKTDPNGRRWLFVPYDQLSDAIGPLSREDASEIGIVMVESPWKAARRPYHRQKLALILANGRHFALEQAARGVAVRVEVAHGPYHAALESVARELGGLRVMRPAEYELRRDLAPLLDAGLVTEIPHEGWLSTPADFAASQNSSPPWRMDALYRYLRRQTGLLMADGRPEGGKFSFDADNRRPWHGEPPAPHPPVFEPDEITVEVIELIEDRFARHPGAVCAGDLPATAADAEALWRWARTSCLPWFGPYEDAMTSASSGLFHTRISGLLNIHRLLPRQVVEDVTKLNIPLQSREGFIRQVLGWREFVHHVHEHSDGFRTLPGIEPAIADAPGDGGWSRWSGERWDSSPDSPEMDGGSCPSALGADRPLPAGYWPGHSTGLECLDHVVDGVWAEAWSHHIPRLMVLANIATLLDVAPRELTDWFWVAYIDAFDWVVEPNVLAMGCFAVGPLMTTKPYVSGAAYIHRMGDFCADCTFDPKTNCPITSLYWSFLGRHRDQLADNHRMRMMFSALDRRSERQRHTDEAVFSWVVRVLSDGGVLRPQDRPEADDG